MKRPKQHLMNASAIAFINAATTNLVIYYIALWIGWIRTDLPLTPPQQQVSAIPVLLATFIGVAGASAIYILLRNFFKHPHRVFRWVAAIGLLASFATPFSLTGAPVQMILTLEFMHIVVAAAVVWQFSNIPNKK